MAIAALSVRRNPLLAVPVVLLMVAAAAVTLIALRMGAAPFGTSWSNDAQACVETAEAPGQSLPEPLSAARQTWMPLGVICSVDLTGSGHPVTTAHQSWAATITVLVGSLVFLVSLTWLVLGLRPRRSPRAW